MALSSRAFELSKPDPKYFFWEVLQNLWDPESNPDGFVSLGVAENVLMHDVLSEQLHKDFSLQNEGFTYGDGKKRLRAALGKFLTRYFNPVLPVAASHISVTNGCSSAIEHAAWAFGEPGDLFLLGKPYYGTFVPDVTLRMGTKLAMVDFHGTDPLSLEGVAKYEAVVQDAHSKGKRVAGLILAHPHNPLGRCYSPQVIIELMRLCERHKIHFISDEIYALSTFTNEIDQGIEISPFKSVLSFDTTGIIDPARLHVIWGISKDFGANGLRLGAIISQHNEPLHRALVPPSLYSSTSSVTDQIAISMFEDEKWIDHYIVENRRLLADSYAHVARWAQNNGIEYAAGVNAAFFLWVNLGAAYQAKHDKSEQDDIDQVVTDALLSKKVFLASGAQFGSEDAGWFRIVFTQEKGVLDEGLRLDAT